MSNRLKIIISLAIAIIITALLFIIKIQYDHLKKVQAIENSIIEMKQLQDNIVRNESKYVTDKQLKDFAKDAKIDLKPIEDDLKELNAQIKGINKVTAITPGGSFNALPSTSTKPRLDEVPETAKCPDGSSVACPDRFGYLKSTQLLDLYEPLSNGKKIPWGQAGFSAWKEKPWNYSVLPRKYTSTNVISIDEDGRHFVHSKMYVETDGKVEDLPIYEAKFVEKYPESKFRFNPALYIGMDAGISDSVEFDSYPGLTLSLFNYGKFKDRSDWTFLSVGMGYAIVNDRFIFTLNPVNYNISNHIPLVNNLYAGPSIALDFDKNVYLSLGIHVGL